MYNYTMLHPSLFQCSVLARTAWCGYHCRSGRV